MRVSVIVPVYNGRTYIERCLGSIVPQLDEDMEVIVVDDASDDGTFEVLEERYKDDRRVILVRSYLNRGVAASRNTGILLSRGDYISFCDSDDEWKEDKLKRQLRLLEENEDQDMCFCDCENIMESDSDIARELMESAREDRIHFRCGLMRREVFKKTGLLNEEMRIREDTEWLVRARKASYTFDFIDESLYIRHIYDEGLSASADPKEKKQRILDAFMKGLKNEHGDRCIYDLSVMIPVYNAEKYLEEAVKSCHSDKHSCEIIMVNDGSKDGSLEVMKRMAEELKDRIPVTICHRAHKN